jgi:peptidoglycan hydrolase-like protein with peptidoglycan-binding domain
VHQYALDVVARYGGHTMAIDRNFVDLGSSPTTRRTPATCGRGADRAHYRPLRRGDRGARVKTLQCLLGSGGHHRGGVTGSFGTETRTAVRAFQQRRGLRVTGRANERTWTALLATGPRPVLKRGSEGPAVRRLQRALTSALPGVVAVHGHFGPATTSAVLRYQARTGLRVTGVASPGTWRALRTGEVVHAKHAKKHRHGVGRDDHKGGKGGKDKKHGKKTGHDKTKNKKSSKSKKGNKGAKSKRHGHGKAEHGHKRR